MFWQFPANAAPLILNTTLRHFGFDNVLGFMLFAKVTVLGAYLPSHNTSNIWSEDTKVF